MNDDLDDGVIGAEDEFDEFSQKASIGDTIRKSPAAKVGIVVAAVAVIVGAMMVFGQETVKISPSMIPHGSNVSSVPGTDDVVAPAYIEAVEQQNEADLERAIKQGGSSIPVPIETSDTRLAVPEVEEETEDPLHRWRLLQEERVDREMKSKKTEDEPVTVLNSEQQSEAIQELSESMAEQMESVLSRTTEVKTFNYISVDYSEGGEGGGGSNGEGRGGGGSNGDGSFTEEVQKEVIIPAGEIEYGQLLLEANSEVPSVIMALMVSGPLKGSKLLGSFEVQDDISLLTITFKRAIDKDGVEYEINALMLDPDTSLAAMRTDIDNRYFRRIVLPAASAFIDGFAGAMAESGRTTLSVSGQVVTETEAETTKDQEVATGVEEAASKITEIIDDIADVDPIIIIKAGTPMGIFFIDAVVTEESDI